MAQTFKTAISLVSGAASSQAVAAKVDGDTQNRVSIDAGGKITWGSGSAAGDTTLYRSAADTLKSDDAFTAASLAVTGAFTLPTADGTVGQTLKTDGSGSVSWASSGATVSATAPSSPVEGDVWFESDTGDIFVYYDSVWVDVGGTSVANIAMSDTAPADPSNGDFWFETDTGKTFVYYNDGSSSQWIEVGAASAASSGVDGAVQFASGGTFSSDASNFYWDDTNNRLGIGTTSPETPLNIVTTNKLGATFTGTADGEGVRVDQSDYTAGNYVSLIEGSYDDGQTAPHVRIGAMYDGGGSNLAIGTSNSYVNGITNTAMFIDSSGSVGIGTTSPGAPLHLFGAGNTVDQIRISSTGGTVSEYGFLAADASTDVMRYGYWTGSGFGNHHFEGNVGIGTSSPIGDLDINGNSSTLVFSSPSNTNRYRIDANISDAADYGLSIGYWDGSAYQRTLTVDDSGDVGIGTTSPAVKVEVADATNAELRLNDTGGTVGGSLNAKLSLKGNGSAAGVLGFNNTASGLMTLTNENGAVYLQTKSNDSLLLRTNSATRMTVTGGGDVGIGTTSPQVRLHVQRGTGITAANYSGDFAALIYHAANSSTKHGLLVANQWIADASTLIEAGNIYATNAAYTKMFYVTGYGRSYNYYGTWGTISDQTLKTEIVDANSQLQDILDLRFVNYKFIKDVERDPDTAPRLFGLLAQEVEQVSPGLVIEDAEGVKTVNTSVLSMKAVKAMQEMHALIETQQETISTLIARIEALEAN